MLTINKQLALTGVCTTGPKYYVARATTIIIPDIDHLFVAYYWQGKIVYKVTCKYVRNDGFIYARDNKLFCLSIAYSFFDLTNPMVQSQLAKLANVFVG